MKTIGNKEDFKVKNNAVNYATFNRTSDNFRFAASVAEFGMLLRNSEFKSQSSFAHVLKIAGGAKGRDAEGYRKEFFDLVKKAQALNNGDDVAVNENDCNHLIFCNKPTIPAISFL